jgi:uncharacterized protein (UPF0218 family)
MDETSIVYRMPGDLRNILNQPIGKLLSGDALFKELRQCPHMVSIGDQVTYTLLHHNLLPRIAIVDFIIKRSEYPEEMRKTIQSFGSRVIQVSNPPGCITKELMDALREAFAQELSSLSLRIEVDGEEDLASLAAILLAPNDVTIIYGLPDKGVIVVPATEDNKERVRAVLAKM